MFSLYITLGLRQFSVSSPQLLPLLFIRNHLNVAGASIRIWSHKRQSFIN